MILFEFLLAVLITWRVTYMVQQENLPYNLGTKLRRHFKTDPKYANPDIAPGSFRDFISCFRCFSLYVAIPCAIYMVDGVLEVAAMTIAINAAAILLHNYTQRLGL